MEHILILEWINESLFYMCFTLPSVFLQYFVIFVIKKNNNNKNFQTTRFTKLKLVFDSLFVSFVHKKIARVYINIIVNYTDWQGKKLF